MGEKEGEEMEEREGEEMWGREEEERVGAFVVVVVVGPRRREEEESLADSRILVIESPMLAMARRMLSPLSTVGS